MPVPVPPVPVPVPPVPVPVPPPPMGTFKTVSTSRAMLRNGDALADSASAYNPVLRTRVCTNQAWNAATWAPRA